MRTLSSPVRGSSTKSSSFSTWKAPTPRVISSFPLAAALADSEKKLCSLTKTRTGVSDESSLSGDSPFSKASGLSNSRPGYDSELHAMSIIAVVMVSSPMYSVLLILFLYVSTTISSLPACIHTSIPPSSEGSTVSSSITRSASISNCPLRLRRRAQLLSSTAS